MFDLQQAIHVWLTLWISFQYTYDEVNTQGIVKSPGYTPLPYADVQYWTHQMNELIDQVSDQDIEFYIPQLTAVLLRQDVPTRSDEVSRAVISSLGSFLINKALTNHMIAMHIVWQLRAARVGKTGVGAWRSSPAGTIGTDSERAQEWLGRMENAGLHGRRLPRQLESRRQAFFRDNIRFVERLVNLSRSLTLTDTKYRLAELHRHLGDINRCLLRRIETRGRAFENPIGGEWALDDADFISSRPDMVNFAIVLPVRAMNPGCSENMYALRVLRIVKELSHPLQSRERVPYMVTAEVLQTSIGYESHRLYLQGDRVGMCVKDVIEHREVPDELMHELETIESETEHYDSSIMDQLVGSDKEDEAFFSKAFSHYHNWSNVYMEKTKQILHNVFASADESRIKMLRSSSPFGHLKGWKLTTFIVKAGDDVRQEALAMQVISLIDKIWKKEGLDLWLRPYAIVCVGHESGLVECLTDAKSVDEIKKKTPEYTTMQDYFERLYMGPGSGLFERAQNNFIRSLAGYCIVTYLLQVKDRHNANIMLDTRGHIIHIDFGFILGNSPGLWTHETAPFKLTQDYIDIIGGQSSRNWIKFQELFLAGFRAVQKNINDIASLVQVMLPPNDRRALLEIIKLKKRLMGFQSDDDILGLIRNSANSLKTWQYDYIQSLQNGIAM